MRDLSDELEDLSELDELRTQARELWREGMNALRMVTDNHPASWNGRTAGGDVPPDTTAPTRPPWQGSGGLVETAMLVRLHSKLKIDVDRERPLLVDKLTVLSLKQNLLQLETGERSDVDEVPVLLAARAMQALVASTRHTFSKATMLCYYRIIREIYVADSPDWNAGGARAGAGGEVTAYVTAECIRGVLMLARSIRRTAEFFRSTDEFYRYAQWLQTADVPAKWREVESERAAMEWYVTMAQKRPFLALHLPLPSPAEDNAAAGLLEVERFTLEGMMHYLTRLGDAISKGFADSLKAFQEALREIEESRHSEVARARRYRAYSATDGADQEGAGEAANSPAFAGRGELRGAGNRVLRSVSAHRVAEEVMRKAVRDAVQMAEDSHDGQTALDRLARLAAMFETITGQVKKLLDPAKRYIASVMDHELTSAAQERPLWDARELAFAAGAYGALTDWRTDERLVRAAGMLIKDISEDGQFRPGKPFHSVPSGLRWQTLHFEVCRALSELLQNVEVPVHPHLIKQMLFPFIHMSLPLTVGQAERPRLLLGDTGGNGAVTRLRGWHMEDPPIPARPTLWVTGHAVIALDKIARMLDRKINSLIISDHFSSKTPDKINHTLDRLFYPDYGRELFYQRDPDAGPHAAPEAAARESIGITLQRMRAHIYDIRLPQAYGDPLFSVVLHGPPGTGKTTLLEALARSAGVPLIEMSPSDIAVKGEEAIEGRARATFRALSMLTKVVILFDEFEPVLLRRDPDEQTSGERDIYTFLTPGMLPKLTRLHTEAKGKRVAYALVTNHLKKLDDAAIRPGRFDHQVGIYMPDPVSRAGFFMRNLVTALEAREAFKPEDQRRSMRLDAAEKARFHEILEQSGNVPPSRLAPRWLAVAPEGSSIPGGGNHVLEPSDGTDGRTPWESPPLVALAHPRHVNAYRQLHLLEEKRLNGWEWALRPPVKDDGHPLPGPRTIDVEALLGDPAARIEAVVKWCAAEMERIEQASG